VPDGLAEQTACGRRLGCSAGIDADALALHSHGSALLSIHPKLPARADRHVIAACASSVEQAAGSMGFADAGYRQDNRACGAFVPARRVVRDRKERRDIVRGNPPRATSTFEERGSPRRFRQIYLARVADTGAIQGINFASH